MFRKGGFVAMVSGSPDCPLPSPFSRVSVWSENPYVHTEVSGAPLRPEGLNDRS